MGRLGSASPYSEGEYRAASPAIIAAYITGDSSFHGNRERFEQENCRVSYCECRDNHFTDWNWVSLRLISGSPDEARCHGEGGLNDRERSSEVKPALSLQIKQMIPQIDLTLRSSSIRVAALTGRTEESDVNSGGKAHVKPALACAKPTARTKEAVESSILSFISTAELPSLNRKLRK